MTPRQIALVQWSWNKAFLAAYRYQYIISGVQNQRFGEILGGMISPAHAARIGAALRPILQA